MDKQIIQDILLTKEAIQQYITNQLTKQAYQSGLSLEEWHQAVISGSVITSSQNP